MTLHNQLNKKDKIPGDVNAEREEELEAEQTPAIESTVGRKKKLEEYNALIQELSRLKIILIEVMEAITASRLERKHLDEYYWNTLRQEEKAYHDLLKAQLLSEEELNQKLLIQFQQLRDAYIIELDHKIHELNKEIQEIEKAIQVFQGLIIIAKQKAVDRIQEIVDSIPLPDNLKSDEEFQEKFQNRLDNVFRRYMEGSIQSEDLIENIEQCAKQASVDLHRENGKRISDSDIEDYARRIVENIRDDDLVNDFVSEVEDYEKEISNLKEMINDKKEEVVKCENLKRSVENIDKSDGNNNIQKQLDDLKKIVQQNVNPNDERKEDLVNKIEPVIDTCKKEIDDIDAMLNDLNIEKSKAEAFKDGNSPNNAAPDSPNSPANDDEFQPGHQHKNDAEFPKVAGAQAAEALNQAKNQPSAPPQEPAANDPHFFKPSAPPLEQLLEQDKKREKEHQQQNDPPKEEQPRSFRMR